MTTSKQLDNELIWHACAELRKKALQHVRAGMGPASAAWMAIRETKALFPYDWKLAVQGDDEEDHVEVWEIDHKWQGPCASVARVAESETTKPLAKPRKRRATTARAKMKNHAKRRAYDINPSSPDVIKAFMKSRHPATEEGIQEFIAQHYGDWMRQLKRRYPDIDASAEWDTITREFTAALERHFKFEDEGTDVNHKKPAHAKMGRQGYENGQRVVVLDYLGHEIGQGRVRSGDNYPESNEHFTWVTMTRHGETITEEHPTRRVVLAR